jgi:competence protein ComEC
MFENGNAAVEALHETIGRHKVPIRVLRAGDLLDVGDDCTAKVLHPPHSGILGSDNANSLVLAVEYRGRRIMLPGDLQSPGLDNLLAKAPWRCDVLMAPHHGARQNNTPALAAWCRPRWVVFSDDARRPLPDVDATYRAVGGLPLHTHLCGAVRVRIGPDGIDVSQFVKSE